MQLITAALCAQHHTSMTQHLQLAGDLVVIRNYSHWTSVMSNDHMLCRRMVGRSFSFFLPSLSLCVCVGMCVRLCQCAPGRCLKLLQQGTTLHPLPTFRRQSSAVRVNGGMAHRNRLPSPRTQTVKIRPTHVHRMKDFSGCLGGRAANYISAQ